MGERLRLVDPRTIDEAVDVMEERALGLYRLVEQLRGSIDASRRAGGTPSVDVLQGFQDVGRDRLGEFRNALDSLTVGGRRSRGGDITALEGTVRGGTDIDI